MHQNADGLSRMLIDGVPEPPNANESEENVLEFAVPEVTGAERFRQSALYHDAVETMFEQPEGAEDFRMEVV